MYQCIGGPIDGVYFFLHPDFGSEPASHLLVELEVDGRWRGYSYACEKAGGVAEVDHVRLNAGIHLLTEPGKGHEITNMVFESILSAKELAAMLKGVRRRKKDES